MSLLENDSGDSSKVNTALKLRERGRENKKRDRGQERRAFDRSEALKIVIWSLMLCGRLFWGGFLPAFKVSGRDI